jgi:signal transduction histidine kinase/ActR/RegA family two-component response regulator
MEARSDTPPPALVLDATPRLRLLARVSAAAGTALGVLGMVGWVLDVPWLRSFGQPIEMQPNTALAIAMLGVAALAAGRGGRWAPWVARASAMGAALIGGITLAEHVSGLDLGIDGLLFPHALPGVGSLAPGRMGPPSAANLLAGGVAVLLVEARSPRATGAGQALAACAVPVPLLGVVGYLYTVEPLYGVASISAIALPTAVAQLLLDVAVVLARTDRGLAGHLASRGAGSAAARRMLLYAFAVPVGLGGAALGAVRAGLYDASFAVSVLVVALVIAFAALVLRDARTLDRLDASRRRARMERERSRQDLADALSRERVAREQAEQASRAKDQFLSMLSHELRTPLNAILGWSALLRDGGDPQQLARGLAAVERNGKALAQLVSDLLDMSRIASGKLRIERADVDLAGVVSAALASIDAAAAAKGIRIERALEGGVPPVRGDAARLGQLAWNLLSNAVRFGQPGGKVEVRLAREDDRAVLEVRDDGIGMSPDILPPVFELFTQADGSSSRAHGGLGLGLALSREIVHLHGGDIAAESGGPGLGALFRVRLPLAAAEAAAAARDAGAALAGARVLVVDDEPDSRDLLLALLGSWGAVAVGVGSVLEALQAIARERPDVVVSDIAMPGQDGFALVETLRRTETARLPAVAITAFARSVDRDRALASGFDAHLPKPIQPEALRTTLAALLAREGARRAAG